MGRGNQFAWMTTATIVPTGEKSTGLPFHNVSLARARGEGISLDSKRIKSIPAATIDRLITEGTSVFIDTATDTAPDTSAYKSGKLICVHNGARVCLCKMPALRPRVPCMQLARAAIPPAFGHFCPIKFGLSESFK